MNINIAALLTLLMLTFSGCAGVGSTDIAETDKVLWQKYAELAHARAYYWLSRSCYGTAPWFVEGQSLVYEGKRLVALRYHMAFVSGPTHGDMLKQYQSQKRATHILEYNFINREWRLILPAYPNSETVKEDLPNQ